MKNSNIHRKLAYTFRHVLRFIHRIFAFINFQKFDKWLLPHAACVYICNDKNQVLAVSRRDDKNNFGLVGGKVDPGETDAQAGIRELFEETGISLDMMSIRKIYEATDDFEYWTTCYLVLPEVYVPEPSSCEKGFTVKWVEREQLIAGCFGNFNKKLFKIIDEKMGYLK
jgi:8-oxo-dGTP pyrophosphatase MutT (NUDIX family)